MQVVLKAADLWPDPEEAPSREQCRQWLADPVTRLVLARLHRKAYPFDFKKDDEFELLEKARVAQGVQSALEVIQQVVSNASNKEE
jgi:hypothetical protein